MRPETATSATPPRCRVTLSATTLVALAAMTAAVAGAPSPVRADMQGRTSQSAETVVVRAVAAAVAAVARDLAGSERPMPAAIRLVAAPACAIEAGAAMRPRRERDEAPAGDLLLDERLIDRPPPRA